MKNKKIVSTVLATAMATAKMCIRDSIYGVCFPTAEELEAHLKELEEAKERDHRKIGKEMELFMTDDLVGRGLPMFLPKGYTVWQELENYIKDKERRLGYLHVLSLIHIYHLRALERLLQNGDQREEMCIRDRCGSDLFHLR